MSIPYAQEYTSTATGGVLKLVGCEGCGAEYVYRMEREATGSGTSLLFLDNSGASARAEERAMEALRRKLDRGVDLVPCPACGHYQSNMLPKARREHRRWMLVLGACLTLGLLPFLFLGGIMNSVPRDGPLLPWPVFLGGSAVVAAAGVGLMVTKVVSSRGYDPNGQDAEARKQLGRLRAMLRADFERLAAAPPADPAGG